MQPIEPIQFLDEAIKSEISDLGEFKHVTYFHTKHNIGGSGFAQTVETAKKIAFSELNERWLVFQLRDKCTQKWGFDFDQSCSGFAVGFSQDKTILRSICEATERWALSKWVDEGYAIEQVSLPIDKSMMVAPLIKSMDRLTNYHINIPLIISGRILNIHITVVLMWKDSGVYAGYGAKTDLIKASNHAAIEAIRNFLIHKNQPQRDFFPYNRIHYFSQNAEKAIVEIEKARIKAWIVPELKLSRNEQFDNFWLARTIFEGWEPWQNGTEARFLY